MPGLLGQDSQEEINRYFYCCPPHYHWGWAIITHTLLGLYLCYADRSLPDNCPASAHPTSGDAGSIPPPYVFAPSLSSWWVEMRPTTDLPPIKALLGSRLCLINLPSRWGTTYKWGADVRGHYIGTTVHLLTPSQPPLSMILWTVTSSLANIP